MVSEAAPRQGEFCHSPENSTIRRKMSGVVMAAHPERCVAPTFCHPGKREALIRDPGKFSATVAEISGVSGFRVSLRSARSPGMTEEESSWKPVESHPWSSRKPVQSPPSVIPDGAQRLLFVIPESARRLSGIQEKYRPRRHGCAWFLDSGSRLRLARNDGGGHPGSPRIIPLGHPGRPRQPTSGHSGRRAAPTFCHPGKREALIRDPGKISATAARMCVVSGFRVSPSARPE